jgi:hypothetical protein
MLRAMAVEVTAKTVQPTPTAVVVAATTRAEFPKMWGPMLDQVWSLVSGAFDPAGDVVPSALPGGLVATATHTGPIAEIGDTHQAVCEWSKANGYRLAGPHWEIYGDPDPSTGHFDVDVFWSLATP